VLENIKINSKLSLIGDPKEHMFQIGLSPEQKMMDTGEAKIIEKQLAISKRVLHTAGEMPC